MTRRIVFVTQAYPPVGGSHVTRSLALAATLDELGEVVVVTIQVGSHYPQQSVAQGGRGRHVVRTFPGFAHATVHGRGTDISRDRTSASSRRPFGALIRRTAEHVYRRISVIDSYFDWIPHLARAVRSHAKRADLVVSTSMPNSVHVATLVALKGLGVTWIADFGDPWTLDRSNPSGAWRGRLERRLERAVVDRADALVFATDATLADYAEAYPAARSRMHLVRMGYEVADEAIEPAAMPPRSVFYGGSLPANNRSAGALLEVVGRRSDISYIFAGSCVETVQRYFIDGLPTNVTCYDWLDHDGFIAAVKGSDVSLILGNRNPQQVPGKLYQLSAFAPRILYIRNMPEKDDEGLRILGGSVEAVQNSTDEIEAALERLLARGPAHLPRDQSLSWAASMAALRNLVGDFAGQFSQDQ